MKRSSVYKLPKKRRSRLEKDLLDQGKTLDDIQKDNQELSKSAIWRYGQKLKKLGEEAESANSLARAMVEKMQEEGGLLNSSKAILALVQTAVLNKLVKEESLEDMDLKELKELSNIIRSTTNSLVDIGKVPKEFNDETEEQKVTRLASEVIKNMQQQKQAKNK